MMYRGQMTKELKDWTDEELEAERQRFLLITIPWTDDETFGLSVIESEQKLRKDVRSRPDYGMGP